jgi:hypothetical protein
MRKLPLGPLKAEGFEAVSVSSQCGLRLRFWITQTKPCLRPLVVGWHFRKMPLIDHGSRECAKQVEVRISSMLKEGLENPKHKLGGR